MTDCCYYNTITKDTTIFVKIIEVQENTNNTTNTVEKVEKDNTPKTGIENYLGIAVLTVLFSTTTIVLMKNKNKKG